MPRSLYIGEIQDLSLAVANIIDNELLAVAHFTTKSIFNNIILVEIMNNCFALIITRSFCIPYPV